jgi:predicted GNAT superfamily acetyltransferase
MSRLTGSDALGLYEAYQAVYAPQELTEEQVWEEVETWVNSLLEEGYDLSDYTWEEMYEAYVEEARAEGVKPYKP